MTVGSVCIDASLLIRLLRSGTANSPIRELWLRWEEAGIPLVAPTLFYYELANALHRYAVHGDLRPEEAATTLDDALTLKIALSGDAALHRRALELAQHYALPAAYDAHYLALAERLNGRVLDGRPPALPGSGSRVALGASGRIAADRPSERGPSSTPAPRLPLIFF